MFLFCCPRTGPVPGGNYLTTLLLVNRSSTGESREQTMKIASTCRTDCCKSSQNWKQQVQRDRDWLAEAQSKLLRLQNFAYRRESHLRGRTLRRPLPAEKQVRVCGSQIRTWVHSQLSGRGINPAAWPLDLSNIAQRSLIQNNVPGSVRPLRPELLVNEGRTETQSCKNFRQNFAVGDLSFSFDPRLVPPHSRLGFVSQSPAPQVRAQA